MSARAACSEALSTTARGAMAAGKNAESISGLGSDQMRALVLLTLAAVVHAHGDHDAPVNPSASYAELHMAQEVPPLLSRRRADAVQHHMDNFDIQSMFHLHDLNQDGVLDQNELESIYGVHHEKLKKAGVSVEVHTEKAREIVSTVLKKLDTNGDGVLTMREFVAGGVAGLPNFEGVEHLGHHYGQSSSRSVTFDNLNRPDDRRRRGGVLSPVSPRRIPIQNERLTPVQSRGAIPLDAGNATRRRLHPPRGYVSSFLGRSLMSV